MYFSYELCIEEPKIGVLVKFFIRIKHENERLSSENSNLKIWPAIWISDPKVWHPHPLIQCCKYLLAVQCKVNAGGFGKASTMTYRDTKTDCQHFKMNPSSRILDTKTRT